MKDGKCFLIDDKGAITGGAQYGFESPEAAQFPPYIMFDVTNVCNSHCVHCPQSTTTYRKRAGGGRYLPMELFKKVIDECRGRKIDLIRITADGEPLLHPDIAGMVAYCSAQGMRCVGLTTNGSLFSADIAERLMDAGLFMVDFSLDAATQPTYAKIRKGLPYTTVIANVESTIAARNRRASPLKIMVSFVKQTANAEEEDMFRQQWEGKVDRVLIREMISNINLTPVAGTVPAVRWPCPHVFRRIVINYDGTIKFCPIDWENKTCYRNIGDTGIYEAWHSPFYRQIRAHHLDGALASGDSCKDCPDWAGSPWHLGYEKVVKKLGVTA
ncbi:MAG: radical SAM protein [Candidatus Omnitrophica bacterium]|nr:radical SAM protein [Candidatus Omnitrophota bacterium]